MLKTFFAISFRKNHNLQFNDDTSQIFLHFFKGILLTGAVLETLTCGEGENSEISKILLVPEKQQAVLQAYQMTVCGGRAEQRAELFGELSEELRDQIDTQRVFDQVHGRTAHLLNRTQCGICILCLRG